MADSPPRRLRSKHVALGLTVVAASTLTGCGTDPDYAAICVDPETQERVDDDQCDDSDRPRDYTGVGTGFFWFYMSSTSSARLPAVGQSYNPSAGTYQGSSLVNGGRSVQRGGLPSAGSSSVKSFTRSGGFGSSRGVSSS
jgi:hypothetical protein